jgi:hypothetical protein
VDSLIAAREGLMEDILEEEEEIIALHRQQIEESMDVVRKWVAAGGFGAEGVAATAEQRLCTRLPSTQTLQFCQVSTPPQCGRRSPN